ncbi:ATP-dependent RNA helicase A [Portunus trituberculatus]|uniref:ATP-dependent RNA helicase A n=1 Tax=Portunus trituberculatus TaxID=210409 RepID=A0A5B7FRT2_PORTR|nr:ATP-dependent RNA helicase A [Portunus trituberculatus]
MRSVEEEEEEEEENVVEEKEEIVNGRNENVEELCDGGGGGNFKDECFLEVDEREKMEDEEEEVANKIADFSELFTATPPVHLPSSIQAEDVDLTANIHGNWTVENAKSRLHMFLQTNKIKADYKYSAIGPDHNRYPTPHLLHTRSTPSHTCQKKTAPPLS